MSIKHKIQNFLVHHMGMYWPDGDAAKIRKAAHAWRKFAEAVDDVRGPVNNAATSLIHHNKGEGIEAFEIFWGRYAKGGDAGWLSDLSHAAKKMAEGLEKLADEIDHAMHKLWHQIEVDAAVLGAAVLLAIATGGALSGAAAGAAALIVEAGASLGIAVSTTVAQIAGVTLAGAVFGGLESATVDLAVAQPMKIALGLQDGGINLDEVLDAALDGAATGGVLGGAGAAGSAGARALGKLDGFPGFPSLRPFFGEEGTFARAVQRIKCWRDPIDVATGAMLLPQTDVSLPASLPLVFGRTHVSSNRAGGWFGPTWMSMLDERIQLDAQGVVFASGDGMRLVYPVPKPGSEVYPVKGPRWPLAWDGTTGGAFTITDPQAGVIRTFAFPMAAEAPDAVELLLQSLEDRNGMRIDIERTHGGRRPVGIRHSGGYYLAIDTEGPRVTGLRLLDEPPSAYERERTWGGTVVMRYGYDGASNLTEVINFSGSPLRFTYDTQGRVTSWTDRNGTSYRYVYDERGRVVRCEGSDNFLSGSFEYDDATRTTIGTDSLGHRSVFRHNADGQVVEEINPLGHTTCTVWDKRGEQPLSVTDPLGRTTQYEYDEAGNLIQMTLPDGSTGSAAYNELCRPTEVTEPGGATWRHTYDERGNLLTSIDPLGGKSRYDYDESGNLTATTDPLGHRQLVSNDPAGLPISATDPLGQITTVRRDIFGRVIEMSSPLGHVTRMAWTVEGMPSRREYPDGTAESWTWDGEGNLLSHTDQAGNTTSHTTTHFDLPASRTDPDGTTYTFAHDTELRLTTVTNPQGLTWTYNHDEAGRLTSETDFTGRTHTYVYDAADQLSARTNSAGVAQHFSRDVLGRLTEQRFDNGVTTYEYGAAGTVIRAINADADLIFERDALGRLLAETVNGRKTTYTYDALGRRTQRVTPSGLDSYWTYDSLGRTTELRSAAGRLTFSYDAAGRETERRLGDGATLTQSWDPMDRLTTQSITSRRAEASRLLQHRLYAYRDDGYPTEIRELTSGTRRFHLDRTGRVTRVSAHGWSETYAYDRAGNLKHAVAPTLGSPGSRDLSGTMLRRAGRTAYEHDAHGRLVRKTRKLLNGKKHTWTYTWDGGDFLREVVTPAGERWRYAYDPLGRRISKHRLLGDGSAAEETAFTWDGTRLAEQKDPNGRVTTWDHDPDGYRPLTQTNRTPPSPGGDRSLISRFAEAAESDIGTRFHAIVTDPIGTPTELVSAEGEIAWQQRTSLWGETLPSPIGTSDVHCPLRFPGQYHDVETGLSYNYFRYYDPETGRYATTDPLGLEPAPNPDTYIRNPYVFADPLGLAPCTELGPPKTSSQLRNTPGSVTGGSRLRDVSGQWLKGTDENVGRIPGQVARALQGRQFKNFDEFREAFWTAVSKEPSLAEQFTKSGQTLMSKGQAPYTVKKQALGKNGKYALHHVTPIQRGGGVYDLDNIIVVTPRYHKEVLDPGYHMG